MLEIKRRLGQSFIIDRRITVWVDSYAATSIRRVTLGVDRPGSPRRSLIIPIGESAHIQTLAGCVTIHARWIARGEVALGIEAPLSIDIQRPDRIIRGRNEATS
jgi:sRNA-binding carbon storage regulator CsrA